MAFPLGFWEPRPQAAITAIVLLATSELLSPYCGYAGLVVNKKRLRMAALIVALIFLTAVTYRIYDMITKPPERRTSLGLGSQTRFQGALLRLDHS